ncbi:MAG: hypothetical protein E6J23_03015 [Chloroflexi bacterium]|nr:MAG: hypothetical protein E6J23_03015 [Chloroflexota bacterium]
MAPFRRPITAAILTALVSGLLLTMNADAATARLVMTASTMTPTAGEPFSLTVTAVDQNGNVDPTYAGIVHFATNDSSPDAVMPPDSQLTNGEGTFSATLIQAGSWPTITVSDAPASLSATLTFTVNGAAADHFALSLRTGPTAGYPFSFFLIVVDRYGNRTRSYAGTVHFTTSDTSAGVALPPDQGVCCAQVFLSATLDQAGPQTVTATDTATPSITGTLHVGIRPGPTASFKLDTPPTATAGVPFDITFTLLDRFGNVATGATVPYTGTIHFTSSDSLATLPPDYTFQQSYSGDTGTRIFTATLMTPGHQTITATDTTNASITGTSPTIDAMQADATSKLVVTASTMTPIAGEPFALTVTAVDQNGNVAPTYTGIVHFATNDSSPDAVMPPDSQLTNGQGTFSATLVQGGSQAVTATDTAASSITGTLNVTIRPGPTASMKLDSPSNATMGQSFAFTLTLLDRFGNVATGAAVPYTGTIHFTSSDALATLPPDYTFQQSYYAADTGTRSFSASLVTPGRQTITATDTANASITGTSSTIQVLMPSVGAGLRRP